MIRSPHDGAHLVAPQAQSGSSARVLSATSGNTPRETTPTGVAIPGPSLIVTTMEGDLAANQPNPAARSAGATTYTSFPRMAFYRTGDRANVGIRGECRIGNVMVAILVLILTRR